MSGRQHDQMPEIDLSVLNEDQRAGLTCINCGAPGGRMRPLRTPDNPRSTKVLFHADSAVCLRHVSRSVAGLHMRLARIAEYASSALAQADDYGDR
jgi:hypothetical protein